VSFPALRIRDPIDARDGSVAGRKTDRRPFRRPCAAILRTLSNVSTIHSLVRARRWSRALIVRATPRRPAVTVTALDAFTSYLAQAFGCRSIAAVGLPHGSAAARVHAGRQADLRHSLVTCRADAPGSPRLGEQLDGVRASLDLAPAGVVRFDCAADARQRDVLSAVRAALAERHLAPAFLGYGPKTVGTPNRRSVVAVLEGAVAARTRSGPPPDDFRVVAIVPVRNEEDIVAQTLRDLIGQGVQVHLLDDWSTDATVSRARPFLGKGLLAIERPAHGPSATYDLRDVLRRVEHAAERLRDASWIVLHDADERRRSPWPGVTLREALWRVDHSGHTCVDHVTLNFWPTDDAPFDPDGPDLEERFRYFEFSGHEGHFHQRRAWKQLGVPVGLCRSAGHDVDLPGRRVYPYKFLLKHYPFRSQAHGEAKLLERTRRWNGEERALGWHRQYDDLATPRFVRDRASLLPFDAATFYEEYLVEGLSGAGVFQDAPPWATPPHW
jgi:hypothetical protein